MKFQTTKIHEVIRTRLRDALCHFVVYDVRPAKEIERILVWETIELRRLRT